MSYPPSAATAAGPAVHDPVRAALQMRAQGRLQEALETLSSPGGFSADWYLLRGDLQWELGLFQEAAGSYSTVAAAEPGNVHAQYKLGLCLHRLGRWEAAAEALQVVLQLDRHRDEVRIDLGDCLLHLRRFEEALACFDQCWSDGVRRRALFGRAVALQQLRRLDEAEASYLRLLALDPQAEEAFSNLISMSMEVFDLTRVQKYAGQLLDLNPRSSIALQGLALAALERRDYGIAAAHFFRAAELEPALMRADLENSSGGEAGAVEYRISRKAFDSLVEAVRQQPGAAVRAAGVR